jgi:hydrogenase maturation factor
MNGSSSLPAGKLPGRILERLLKQYAQPDPSVLIGPEIGADAAAILVGDRVIVVKSDPITFPTPDASSYLVNVNANDIACMGATPRWLLVTSLLPEGSTTEADVEAQFQSLSHACLELGISLVGGHTEITVGLDRTIMVGMMIGEAEQDKLLDLRRSRPGDVVILCNGIAIEGTSILASEAADELLDSVSAMVLERARRLGVSPGLSVVPAARALIESGAVVRGMHDPTEGGLATALWELARITRCDLKMDLGCIAILEETRLLCEALGLDPMGLIASGALLSVVEQSSAGEAVSYLRHTGVNVEIIGRLDAQAGDEPGVFDAAGDNIQQFATDEIARYFSRAS